MAASKRKRKKALKTFAHVAIGVLTRTAKALTKQESEWVYPEDALEDALLSLPVALLTTISDEI